MQDRHIALILVVVVFGMVLMNVRSDSYTGQAVNIARQGINPQNEERWTVPVRQAPTPSSDQVIQQVVQETPVSANKIPPPANSFAQALTGEKGMKGTSGAGYAVYNPYAPHDVNKGFMDGKQIYNQNNQMYAGKK